MSAERIAAELDDRFHLLTGGARTVLPRQQTLAASVDWSYDRLDEVEQVLFRRLGVFAGIFPMDGAEHVAAAIGDIDPVTVFDVLSRLVDKNLVVTEERPGGDQHYRLLETLRAYAIERARAAGELGPLRDAQVTFWLDWLDRHEPIVHTDAVIEHLEMFHDSVAAALEWSTRDPAVGLRLLRLLARAWQGSGRPQAALTAVDRLLTDENAERFPIPWAAAAASVCRPRRHRSELARSRRACCGAGGLSPTKPATSTSSQSTTCCSATRRRTATACAGSRTSAGNDTSSASPPWPRLPSRVEADPQRGVGDARRRRLSGCRSREPVPPRLRRPDRRPGRALSR